jgi:hypothetical protein
MSSKIEKKKEKRDFEVDGVKYSVIRPNIQILTGANKIRRETFNQELEAGSLLRDQLEEELRKRELWSDEREANYQRLRVEIVDREYKLAAGGIKLSEAKQLALEMKQKREEMVELLSSRTDLDSNTCEGRADAMRFNYLFANCLVYSDSGEKYFKNGLNDYLLNQEDLVGLVGASEFFYLISETDQVDDKLPENKFLKQFNFVNEKYQLVDKEGRLVDQEGKHIDENGNLIEWLNDKDFIYVDINGRQLDDDGNFKVEFSPFLDDEGNPIGLEEDKTVKKTTARRKKTSPKKEEVV